MIDTHCHLTFPDFTGNVNATLAEAHAAGVTGCITISTTTHDCLQALAIAESHPRIWCSSGVHPLYADNGSHIWANIRRVAEHPKCVAWGELGLDNHYTKPPRDLQHTVLHEQLAFIQACAAGTNGPAINKPIILHCREAFTDLIPILKRTTLDSTRFVFHCFTGTPADAKLALDFGAMISFTGVLTYKNAADVQAAAQLIPLDRLLVETDAPFLSPEPQRGARPCKPAMVRLTAAKLAELKGQSFEAMHEILNDNTKRFFGIA